MEFVDCNQSRGAESCVAELASCTDLSLSSLQFHSNPSLPTTPRSTQWPLLPSSARRMKPTSRTFTSAVAPPNANSVYSRHAVLPCVAIFAL
ncbi:hypothetical protein BC937DRAFT_92782 [Endogone sp. FLAS-F59071]|nr:hypothetical protein BC937DRAFT_92782 [Endogone sp. FLAS-F59071]|eukprot:RUS15182.1 hypothetical protein BC937DRAFT_92782 [Endogone sp. FLAS-F59071]